MLDKTWLAPMAKDDLVNKVNNIKPGTMHYIEWLDGEPITLDDGTEVYVTNKMLVRFKINYGKIPSVRFKKAVMRSISADDMQLVTDYLNTMKPHRVACIGSKWFKLYKDKMEALASGQTLEFVEEKKPTGEVVSSSTYSVDSFGAKRLLAKEPVLSRDKDGRCSQITLCKNGSETLMVYTSFAHRISWHEGVKTIKPRMPEKHYYAKTPEGILAITSDMVSYKALKKILDESRTRAGKKRASTPTEVMTPSLNHIIAIDNSKK